MNYEELKKLLSPWRAAVTLERAFPHPWRLGLKIFSLISFIITSFLFLFAPESFYTYYFLPAAIFLATFWLTLYLLECFYYSYYFLRSKEAGRFAFELALIFFSSREGNLAHGFITSSLGRKILDRAGISREARKKFLSSKIETRALMMPSADHSIFRSYLKGLLSSDSNFRDLIISNNVTEEEFLESAMWTVSARLNASRAKRWWSRENLLNIDALGRSFSYGKSYTLMKYARPFSVLGRIFDEGYHEEEAVLLEMVLARTRGSNALLVGEDGVGKMEVLEELYRLSRKKGSASVIKDKEMWIFDINTLSGAVDNAQTFERELAKVLRESEKAGNIILIIPNLSLFLESGARFGVSTLSILLPALSSSNLQIVGISNTDDYERRLQTIGDIVQHFEKVTVHSAEESTLSDSIQPEILRLEKQTGVFITYPAISEAVSAAKRYFVGKPIVDTVDDLILESVARAEGEGRKFVSKEDILSVINIKTGIPTGAVGEEEKEKLLNLEEFFKKRIVGQEAAIKAVSDAVRRVRSGITNPLRPAASFLFLGPTGVGKTETSKALGEIFFGKSVKFLRLDMSEYNSSDSLNRLIGSFEIGTPGTLVNLLRENPYGVLLLDEFEKAHPKVLDLFLQIIDEGIFSDMHGEKVSARNVILVATSNAGSNLIFEKINAGQTLKDFGSSIVDDIIAQGIFKPELVNRFDGVILFHPLDKEALREISKRMLSRLSMRLKEKGITLETNDALISFLVEKGTDPKFGARPINRAIQETVEQIVAKKIIAGELKPGSTLAIGEEDLK